ncbi:MAG: DUF364 domain-containing protein [Dehalococcoidales bacterium]|nr:DUF364 domain-containing protein [Dehalococcoidales bacterium]
MKILDALITGLDTDYTVEEVYSCVLWTAVKSRNWGLSSSFHQEHPHHGRVRGVGEMRGKPALELAQYAQSDNLLEASIGMATINSLIEVDESQCSNDNAGDILAQKGRGKNIAVVGHFPFTDKLKAVAKNLWVVEQRPSGEDLPAESAKDVLPQADVVGLTGTSLINHTFEDLIKLCKDKFVVMVGPTSPLSPLLFNYGIDVISGIKVIESEKTVACITEGAMFKQIKGLRYLSMRK